MCDLDTHGHGFVSGAKIPLRYSGDKGDRLDHHREQGDREESQPCEPQPLSIAGHT